MAGFGGFSLPTLPKSEDVIPDQFKPTKPKYVPISFDGKQTPTGTGKIGGFSESAIADAQGLADWFSGGRMNDLAAGKNYFGSYFGLDNPQIKGVLDQMKQRANGLTSQEVTQLRDRGTAGINSQMATNLHQLRGVMGASGVRGAATAGAAMPILNNAAAQRTKLEGDIALADMQRRGQALGDYYSALTGERGGLLGSIFGWAGLGAGDRTNALSGVLSNEYIDKLGGVVDAIKASQPTPAQVVTNTVAPTVANDVKDKLTGASGTLGLPTGGGDLTGLGDFIGKLFNPNGTGVKIGGGKMPWA